MFGRWRMNWLNDFAGTMLLDAPIGPLTWFRLGGKARYLCRPRDAGDLALLVVRAGQEGVPLRVLGAGANVLVSDDGFDGVVVRLDSDAFRRVDVRGTQVEVGAGVELMPLVRGLCSRGLSGLECMAGIPATVGGAVRMNAGGTWGEFGDLVQRIRVLGADGLIETWSHDRIGFAYRDSKLGEPGKGRGSSPQAFGRVVLSAVVQLIEDDPDRVRGRYEEILAGKRGSQPLAEHSAGCIFKNPEGVSAGALIDRAGLKGTHWGKACVSNEHANFIVAKRGATASDVLHLIDLIRERVRRVHGTELEVEIEIW